MALYGNFSPLNTVFFTKLDDLLDPSYHTKHYGRFLFRDRTRDFEERREFFAPVQLNQMITIQYEENHNPTGGWPILNILNFRGDLVASFSTSYAVTSLAGNLAPDGSQLYTHQWQFIPNIVGLDEGIYQLHIVAGFATTPEEYISEPINILEDHPGTILLEYSHHENDFDTVFDLSPNFTFRVPGVILRDNPEADTNTFDDQIKDLTLVSATPYRSAKLAIAGDTGVADWVPDVVNWIFCCSSVKVDDKTYTRDGEGKMEIFELEGSPFVGAQFPVREDNPSSPFQHKSKKVLLFEIPEDEYFIYELKVIWGAFIRNFTLNTKGAIFSGADLDDYIDDVNNTVVIPFGMTGEVVEDDGAVYYINGSGEDWQINSSVILTKYLQLTVNVSSTATPFEFQHNNGKAGVSWGNGTINRYVGPALGATRLKSYASTGDKTVYIFHDDLMTHFVCQNPGTTDVTDIHGKASAATLQFVLNNQTLPIFDWSVLHPCKSVIQLVAIQSSNLEEFINLVFNPGGPASFAALNALYLNSNKIAVADLDSLIVAIYNGMNYFHAWWIRIENQTPPAPPTTAASEYIAVDNAGATIIHD